MDLRSSGSSENASSPPRTPREPWWVKLVFVAVFLAATALSFMASAPLSDWVKSSGSELFRNLAVQAVIALPVMLLVFFFEGRLIWKLVRQDVFSTIHPISIGLYVGYVIHFALP